MHAWSVALQHPAIAADQRNICTLLQVSKTVRTLLQQPAAGLTVISFNFVICTHELPKVSSFAAWVARHPGLIRSISITFEDAEEGLLPSAEPVAVLSAVQQLLEFSLNAAGNAAALGVDFAAGPAAAQVCQLRSYSSNIPISAGLLAALPANSLTHVKLKTPDSHCWLVGLSRLQHLQDLTLQLHGKASKLASEWAPVLNKLTQLSNIKLVGIDNAAASQLQHLPASLQQMKTQTQQHVHVKCFDRSAAPGAFEPAGAESCTCKCQRAVCLADTAATPHSKGHLSNDKVIGAFQIAAVGNLAGG